MSSKKGTDTQLSGLSAFWAELKRRKVMRVAITYIIASIAIIEFASATFGYFDIPKWAFQLMTLCLVCGFPIAVIIAWAFELTPDGIKTTKAADEERDDTPVPEKQLRKRNWFTFLFGAAVPTIIFGTLALVFYIQLGGDSEAEIGEKSIAVLPLENMSPDPENAFFANGVQEDILTNLARVDELHVIARTSTQQYRDTTKTVGVIGEELGVNYLVEGSVRRAGNQVKVTVQLIDCESGNHIWADDYDRRLEDIFAIQAEVAKEIAAQLHAALSPEEIKQIEYRPTEIQEAYDNYIKYRQLVEASIGGWDVWIELLENAVQLDPTFVEAWAMLAVECAVKWDDGTHRSDPNLISRARYALGEATRLNSESAYVPFARAILAWVEEQNMEAITNLLLQALAIDPSFYRAQAIVGAFYTFQGRMTEAQYHLEAAYRTNPIHSWANRILLYIYEYKSQWDEARAFIKVNQERENDKNVWQRQLIELEYLKTGNKEKFHADIAANSDLADSPYGLFMKSLHLKDFEAARQSLENLSLDPQWGLKLCSYFASFNFQDKNLVAALLFFEQKNQNQWTYAAEKALENLEAKLENDSKPGSDYLSNLTICYALLGEWGLMETMTERTRERVETPFNNFHHKARCELHIAIAYLVIGDHDKAIETLEAASKMDGPIFLARELDLWFIFDRLRGNPRFDALLEDN